MLLCGENRTFVNMKQPAIFLFILIFLVGCESAPQSVKREGVAHHEPDIPEAKHEPELLVNGKDTLVKVDAYNPDIYWELKYATAENFMKRVLYDTLKAVYIQKDIALRLAECQALLSKTNPDLHLLVYDGVRPLSVQWEMWNALDSIPPAERGKFVSNPQNGSVHNYGAAVDITICDANRKPIDMGAGYDDIRKIAYPSLEAQFLASGELKREHVANRALLRRIMRSQRFSNIPTEWWHFNAYPRAVAKTRYEIVTREL